MVPTPVRPTTSRVASRSASGLCSPPRPSAAVAAEEHVGDHRDLGAHAPAEQLAERPAGRLAHDVEACGLERLDRVLPGVALVGRQVPEVLQDALAVERVLAQEERLRRVELKQCGVSAARLGDALDTLVGLHPDDDAGPGAVDAAGPEHRRLERDVDLVEPDARDPHRGAGSELSGNTPPSESVSTGASPGRGARARTPRRSARSGAAQRRARRGADGLPGRARRCAARARAGEIVP